MTDWDNESEPEVLKKKVTPVPKKSSKWEGEDEDDNKVASDWDDSDEEQGRPAPKAVVASAPKKKGNLKAKLAEKEAEKAVRRAAGIDSDEDEVGDVLDAATRKRLEREREVDADLANATELLGRAAVVDPGDTPELSSLLSVNPTTKPELEAFAKQIYNTVIKQHESKPLYSIFVELLAKELAQPLRDVETRKVASTLTALANEKQKEQKDKASGKKKPKAAAKPVLGATKPGKVDTRIYEEALDDFGKDPDDFM